MTYEYLIFEDASHYGDNGDETLEQHLKYLKTYFGSPDHSDSSNDLRDALNKAQEETDSSGRVYCVVSEANHEIIWTSTRTSVNASEIRVQDKKGKRHHLFNCTWLCAKHGSLDFSDPIALILPGSDDPVSAWDNELQYFDRHGNPVSCEVIDWEVAK